MKLDTYLIQHGSCSRRKADELVREGSITVNHWVVTEPTYIVQEKDTVRYKKQIIKPQPLLEAAPSYILLYKPAGYVTTTSDEQSRKTIYDLIKDSDITARLFPVGRLDIHTTGVLLLTDDGELAHKLAHPSYEVEKVYQVTLNKPLAPEAYQTIKKGLRLVDGPIAIDKLEIGYSPTSVRITIHSGRNRIVRRIFESLGYTVDKLERIGFAGIPKRGLALGQWRFLHRKEVALLKNKTSSLLKK